MNLNLVLAAPFAAALLSFFLSGKDALSTRRTGLALGVVVALFSIALLGHPDSATLPVAWFSLPVLGTPFQWGLRSTGMTAWLVALSGLLVPVSLLLGARAAGERQREFTALVFLLHGLMAGALLAADLFLFYLFFEAMLIPATVLIALFGGRDRRRAALGFLGFSLFGSAPLFVSIWWLATMAPLQYGATPGLEWSTLASTLQQIPDSARAVLFGTFALAFLVKLPVVPFHLWQADAYSEGPAAGSALLTGVMAKIGLFGFAGILIPLFPIECARYAGPFVVTGLVTVLFGALMAYQQRHVRRVLAFSSLSHLGLGLAALFTFRPEAQAGVLLLMVAHGLSAAVLFLLTGVAEKWANSNHIEDFGALASRSPLFATLFMGGALASIGLPGTAGFVAEFLMLVAIFKVWGGWIALLAGLSVVLSAAYTLRLVQKMLFGQAASPAPATPVDLEPHEALAAAPLIALLFVLGFFPAPVLKSLSGPAAPTAAHTLTPEDAAHAAGR